MINPEALAAGVAVGIAAEQGNKFIQHVRGEETLDAPTMYQLLREQTDFLRLIAERLSSELTPPLNTTTMIFAYPQEYRVPRHKRAHFSMFIPTGVSGPAGAYTPTNTTIKLYIETPGLGSTVKTVNTGWVQLDLPADTMIATADGNNYVVVMSFRDDPIGAAL